MKRNEVGKKVVQTVVMLAGGTTALVAFLLIIKTMDEMLGTICWVRGAGRFWQNERGVKLMDPRKRTNVLMLIMYAVVLILVAGFFMEMHAQVDELQQDVQELKRDIQELQASIGKKLELLEEGTQERITALDERITALEKN